MYTDESGSLPNWAKWLIGAAIILGTAALTVATAGGFAAAGTALLSVFSATMAPTAASAIFAGAFVGSVILGGAGVAIGGLSGGNDWDWDNAASGFALGATIGALIGGAISGRGARNTSNIANNLKLSGKGASAVKAIRTATSRYLSGDISKKGLQGTMRLWWNTAFNAIQDAIEPTIRKLTINGACAIMSITAGSAVANFGISKFYEFLGVN